MFWSPLNSVSELVEIVEGLIDFENVSTTCVFSPTLVAPFAGVIVTVGGVVSTVFAVVNVPPLTQALLPASSSKLHTVVFINVLAGYGDDASGVNVTAAPLTL